jgi:hypothetical protein
VYTRLLFLIKRERELNVLQINPLVYFCFQEELMRQIDDFIKHVSSVRHTGRELLPVVKSINWKMAQNRLGLGCPSFMDM